MCSRKQSPAASTVALDFAGDAALSLLQLPSVPHHTHPTMTEVDARKLTKKERKAIAFRANKGKGKKPEEDQDEVPEQEDLDVAEDDRNPAAAAKDKKRKRGDDEEATPAAAAATSAEGATTGEEQPKKKKRQRGGMNKPKISPGEDAEGKAKLVLFIGEFALYRYSLTKQFADPLRVLFCADFVLLLSLCCTTGNLPFKVTLDQIKTHFAPCGTFCDTLPRYKARR